MKLNNRQIQILDYINKTGSVKNKDVKAYIEKILNEPISRVTINRDLEALLSSQQIISLGQGRNVSYQPSLISPVLRYFDVDTYFLKGPDDRALAYEHFNLDIFDGLSPLFSEEELLTLNKLNQQHLQRITGLSPTLIKKELERLTIELSWKSSQLEGNTYSLIDTELLIKENREAEGHKKEEAIMILNHKSALEYALSPNKNFINLSISKIESLHSLIVKDLGVKTGLRSSSVGIVGTKYRPLDNIHQIRQALENAVTVINQSSEPLEKALLANLLIAYIQPFEDGNKRTSRILANAILSNNNFCPLSFRSISEAEYKKAIILFYEQNNASYFKELFIEQFKFAIENYF